MLVAGAKLGPYEIASLLGSGGMGEVYRARDTRLDRTVAIKIIPVSLSSDGARRQRFEREARAISALQHPNICTLYDVGQHDGTDYLVMEYLEGETLASRLTRSRLSAEQVLTYGIEIADALDAAQRRGIIHRDLKPGNIFLTSHGECKVLDFGLAKLEDDDSPDAATMTQPDVLTSPGVAVGTVAYMSPEQARGEPLDARTDIFSLGTVLYEMATGKAPFVGRTSAVVFKAILDATPPPPSQANSAIPPKLDEVIGKCLEKDRELRYQSAAELRADLKRLKRDSTTHASGAVAQTLTIPKRRSWWLPAAVVVLLVLAGVSVVIYRRIANTPSTQLDLQNMKMVRLTDNGKIWSVAISPDGRLVAYFLRSPEHSLWVQQVSTASKVQVVPASAESIRGIAFSPDGNYLYFVRNDKGYVVPALGGTPRLLIESTFCGIGVSPDGKELAFCQGGDAPKSQLIVVNQDGTGERIVAEHPRGSGVRFNSIGAPSWSPDGKLIAMTARRNADNVLNVYPVGGGLPSVISLAGYPEQAVWLPDQSGLFLNMSSSFTTPNQIWFQPYPHGNPQRITNDLDDYYTPSVSKGSGILSVAQEQTVFTIFVGPAAKPEQGKAISTGKSDGIGLAWMPDGTLLSQNVESEFSSLTPDGQRRVLVFKDEVFPGGFSVCKDGRFIIFQRFSAGEAMSIWRIDGTGRGLKQLTEGPQDTAIDCSPDGKSVIYASQTGKSRRVMRISIDGGPTSMLNDSGDDIEGLQYSPNGREIAEIEWNDKGGVLVLRNSQTGQATRSFDMPAGYGPPWNSSGWLLRWTPDGRTLTYALWKGPGTPVNLWSQSLSGGPPRQITNFSTGLIAYDWSPDGKQLALTRRSSSSDVVLISNFH